MAPPPATGPEPAFVPRLPRRHDRINLPSTKALFARQMGRFWNEWPETILAPVFSNLLYLVVFAVALGPDRGTAEGAAAFAFMVPGIVLTFSITMVTAETTIFSLQYDKLDGMVSDWLMPPLTASEITAAFALAGMVAGVVVGLPSITLAVWLFDIAMGNIAAVMAFAALTALFFALLGIVIALWAEKWDHSAGVIAFLVVPTLVLSGTFVPVERVAGPLEALVRLNPVFYAVDGFRWGWTGVASVNPALSAAVLVAVNGLLWWRVDRLMHRGWGVRT